MYSLHQSGSNGDDQRIIEPIPTSRSSSTFQQPSARGASATSGERSGGNGFFRAPAPQQTPKKRRGRPRKNRASVSGASVEQQSVAAPAPASRPVVEDDESFRKRFNDILYNAAPDASAEPRLATGAAPPPESLPVDVRKQVSTTAASEPQVAAAQHQHMQQAEQKTQAAALHMDHKEKSGAEGAGELRGEVVAAAAESGGDNTQRGAVHSASSAAAADISKPGAGIDELKVSNSQLHSVEPLLRRMNEMQQSMEEQMQSKFQALQDQLNATVSSFQENKKRKTMVVASSRPGAVKSKRPQAGKQRVASKKELVHKRRMALPNGFDEVRYRK